MAGLLVRGAASARASRSTALALVVFLFTEVRETSDSKRGIDGLDDLKTRGFGEDGRFFCVRCEVSFLIDRPNHVISRHWCGDKNVETRS